MKLKKLIATVILAVLLLSGCAPGAPPILDPVTAAPVWSPKEAAVPEVADYVIHFYQDLTQSMFGFAGQADSSIAKTTTALTDMVRLRENTKSFALFNSESGLVWTEQSPLLVSAAVLNKEASYYTFQGDFQHTGGPLVGVFPEEADPHQVKVLTTDLLEQDSALDILTKYVGKLFQSDTHQRLRIYVADSAFDGQVAYPVVQDGAFSIGSSYYQGDRPFIIIVTGPMEGVEVVHQVLTKTGVKFAEFMVENRRIAPPSVSFTPGNILGESLLLDAPENARCTLDLAPMVPEIAEKLGDCFAYTFEKVTSNQEYFSRLSLLTDVDESQNLALGNVTWKEWVPQTAEDGTITYTWQSCAPPTGVTLDLNALEAGSAIPDRDEGQTNLEDIVIPTGKQCWELSLYFDETASGKAYSIQAEITSPTAGNPLASTAPFTRFNAHFVEFSQASQNNEILTRIPDLALLLEELARLDVKTTDAVVSNIPIIIQNYETVIPPATEAPETTAATTETTN